MLFDCVKTMRNATDKVFRTKLTWKILTDWIDKGNMFWIDNGNLFLKITDVDEVYVNL